MPGGTTGAFLAIAALALAAAAPAPETVGFARREGLNLNSFVRDGPVSAHILLRSGGAPRIIVAFPAGNSGVGLWFGAVSPAAEWTMAAPARPVTLADGRGRPLHGVTFEASIATPRLATRQALLSSVRVLRDYEGLGTAPVEVQTEPTAAGDTISWARDRLDGAPGYRLSLRLVHGTLAGQEIRAGSDGRITLAVTALSGETPLTPVGGDALLNATANPDPAARGALEFLSYAEKFNAGSWRFNTYFGRDTLMSVRLLMPALQPAAVETGLQSVLERLSPEGRVAHEEDIGEFAILDHRKAGSGNSDAPVYDYKMIDSDYMLAPVARAWLLDDARGRARAAAFFARNGAGAALMRNLRFVVESAGAFARDPVATKLIGLHPGVPVGEWRDSNDGLGGGHYPYDVNAVLVPAALEAADALYRSGLLAPYANGGDKAMFAAVPAMATIWARRAPGLFAITIPSAEARAAIAGYAGSAGVPAAAAMGAAGEAALAFHAIALDTAGRPVPVQNSDEGFALLFARPSEAALATIADTLGRPFPAGLMTGAGLLVANPAFAPAALQARFGPNAYHGTVVWSWQQALAAAGLARQLARTDLSAPIRTRLRQTETCLWRAIAATRAVQSSELWSWRYEGGAYRVEAFGAGGQDADESNAAQLWSTVYLALHRPPPDPAARCQ
ncbi:hypothetical protein [Sphingomonas quercus]|uniref:Lipoprotein n=1 Tax=Sphingomonas quercus TaxID=2842451 RepID=A0ABS6BEU2_9SPHN|nr:hypothetical protein [Sphingomonas quercus]MBU3076828.1 hypothetical protein [Sphingomonas quercus]